MKWTAAQREAIETTGASILVSAAAGSGKTSVLAERCAYLVCDAPPLFRCEVTDLLVVTFTEAAAAEMRSRIAKALHDRYLKSPSQHLARQLALIDHAQISTIHAFCSSVLRQSFHLLELDPNFQMISEEEGRLLRSEIARDVFEDRYNRDETGAFQRLVDYYGDGNDEPLRGRVIHAHALLGSLVDPQRWIADAQARLIGGAEKPLANSELGRALLKRINHQLQAINSRLVQLMTRLQTMPRLQKYEKFASELLDIAQLWQTTFESRGVDGLSELVTNYNPQRRPSITTVSVEEEAVKTELNAIQIAMKESYLFKVSRFKESEWRDAMSSIIEPSKMFLDLVQEFRERYTAAKSEQRVLDFNDLERLALRALSDSDNPTSPSAVARGYQRAFAHVLVDEYQDVNELQDTILTLVSREQSEDNRAANFFCVGDVKQSIYRFRLAEPARFQARYAQAKLADRESKSRVIDLQTNFRSRAELLNTLNKVFQRLMTTDAAEIEYDRAQELHPPSDSPYLKHPQRDPHVELHLLPKLPPGISVDPVERAEDCDDENDLDQAEREAALIATRIQELIGQRGKPALSILGKSSDGAMKPRKLRYGDVAILLRSMRFKSEDFANILRGAGIPTHCDSGGGFFAAVEVQDVLALLKVLDNVRQDIPLAALLRSPLTSIAHAEDALARIRLTYRGSRDNPIPFHDAVIRYANQQRDPLAAQLREVLKQIEAWRELVARRPVAEALWKIYHESGYLAYCEGLEDGAQRVANLIALHEHARTFGGFRRQGLGRFMRFLDQLRDEIEDMGQPSIASEADDAVRIMSIHRSKGLEFPVVFVPDLGKRHNLSDCRGNILIDRAAGLSMTVCDPARRIRYPSLASMVVAENLRRQSLAEEMRVLYVATTRARERLILVGTCAEKNANEWPQRWSEHTGAIPADDVLAGNCMLDWIGPAVTCMQSSDASFTMTRHEASPEDVLTPTHRPKFSETQQALAQLEPVATEFSSDTNDRAETIWRRLTAKYPHDAFKSLKAAVAVTTLAHDDREAESTGPTRARGGELRADHPGGFAFRPTLRSPAASGAEIALSAADIGSATHLFLQRLNFARPCTGEDLQYQLNDLITGRQIAAAEASAINLQDVAWAANESAVAPLLRAASTKGNLLHEVPLNFAIAPDQIDKSAASTLPMDRVMVRGRIDAMIVEPSRRSPKHVHIIDYKTDNVTADDPELARRVEIYQRQLDHYARAVRAMLGCETVTTHLVFLRARVVRQGNCSSPRTRGEAG